MKAWQIGAAATVAGAAGMWYYGNHHLSPVTYRLDHADLPPAFDGLRLLHLSDLHTASFGKNQKQLFKVIDELQADMAVITGDLIDRRRTQHEEQLEPALCLLRGLASRMPTVRVDGNHEPKSCLHRRFTALADATGVQNLTGRVLTVRRGDDHIVFIGIPDMAIMNNDVAAWRRQLHELCAPYAEEFRIVLSHRPQFLPAYAEENLPFVLCGHAHGGQVRLPFVGGLYAPEQGVLPRYTSGGYGQGDTQMIVSRGLGNSGFPMRVGNCPEIGLLTLTRTK